MADFYLKIDSISKSFGSFKAVDSLSLDVPAGSVYGILGPNGAGKTTTIRMILNIIIPDSGRIEIDGNPFAEELKKQIGYLPEERGIFKKMKILDLFGYFGELKGLSSKESKRRGSEWAERLGLKDWLKKKGEELSKGMQQKAQFICTVLHEPKLLILDEPFSGLDPISMDSLKDTILELKSKGSTILFSTHQMDSAEKLCEYICLINRGKKVLDGRLTEVKRGFGKSSLAVSVEGDSSYLSGLTGVTRVDDYGTYKEIRMANGGNPQQLLKEISSRSVVHRFELMEPSLHNIFIEAVKGSEAK
ncbi:MAG: ATP-binding cassette domain-containing protein [candidate division Zixibacteria bacterium]|nr:ATP-binding cassette domain-containing protein [candidate division Zixibacteria bacterium]MCI0596089.1 ATP-binding cassette domain-containing protein [candidate division Zixibacteria bacterium]